MRLRKTGYARFCWALMALPLFSQAAGSSQTPSELLEEIKESLVYQGMNERGYFRSIGFINSGKVENDSTVYVSKFSPEKAITKAFPEQHFDEKKCRSEIQNSLTNEDETKLSYQSRPTPKIGFNHVNFLPSGSSAEMINIMSGIGLVLKTAAMDFSNVELNTSARFGSEYGRHYLSKQAVYGTPEVFQIVSVAKISEKGKGKRKSRIPLLNFSGLTGYARSSFVVEGKITLLKDQQVLDSWSWEFPISTSDLPWTKTELFSELMKVGGIQISSQLSDVNAVARCFPDLKLLARAKTERFVLNAGKSSGLSVGDKFVLIPQSETFKNRGLIAASELSLIAEVARMSRTESELVVIEGLEIPMEGMTFLAKPVRSI
ncbi:MAG: hypothetical protein CMQ40_05305 [Gammaproteobacteria bacterium]|nr:hypothetical protein [Gammaproteobacteria bacterium]